MLGEGHKEAALELAADGLGAAEHAEAWETLARATLKRGEDARRIVQHKASAYRPGPIEVDAALYRAEVNRHAAMHSRREARKAAAAKPQGGRPASAPHPAGDRYGRPHARLVSRINPRYGPDGVDPPVAATVAGDEAVQTQPRVPQDGPPDYTSVVRVAVTAARHSAAADELSGMANAAVASARLLAERLAAGKAEVEAEEAARAAAEATALAAQQATEGLAWLETLGKLDDAVESMRMERNMTAAGEPSAAGLAFPDSLEADLEAYRGGEGGPMRVNARARESPLSATSSSPGTVDYSPGANAMGMWRGGSTFPPGAATLQATVRVTDEDEESDEEEDAEAAALMATRLSNLAFARSTLRGAATAAGVTVTTGAHATSATQTGVGRSTEEEEDEEEKATAARLASQLGGLSFARAALRGAGEEHGLHAASDPLAQAGKSAGDGQWSFGFGGTGGPRTMAGVPAAAGTDPGAVFAGLTQGASGMWEGDVAEDDYYGNTYAGTSNPA
jgi:hypothetical protein